MAAWAARGFPNTETFTSTLKKKQRKDLKKKKKETLFVRFSNFLRKASPTRVPSPAAATHSGTVAPVSCIYEYFIY